MCSVSLCMTPSPTTLPGPRSRASAEQIPKCYISSETGRRKSLENNRTCPRFLLKQIIKPQKFQIWAYSSATVSYLARRFSNLRKGKPSLLTAEPYFLRSSGRYRVISFRTWRTLRLSLNSDALEGSICAKRLSTS